MRRKMFEQNIRMEFNICLECLNTHPTVFAVSDWESIREGIYCCSCGCGENETFRILKVSYPVNRERMITLAWTADRWQNDWRTYMVESGETPAVGV